MNLTKTIKTYAFVVIDAPGYCDNRARVYSRHSTLAGAKKALQKHWVNVPGNPRAMSACIVERETSADMDYVFWSGIRDAGYAIHSF